MNNTDLTNYLQLHENFLRQYIEDTNIPASQLKAAILYSLFPGGKRFRPTLVYACGEILNTRLEVLDIIAISIELMHSFSLVHDDLPAMDDDDYRRGKLSCHKKFDEATAILTGDAIQALAIDILLEKLPKYLNSDKILKITHELIQACGPSGMVSGQCLDMSELINPNTNEETLTKIHHLKTGKLIAACIKMTLASTDVNSQHAKILNDFASELGILFQMQDDYLDKYGENNCLGKLRASDEANSKITFANIYPEAELLNIIKTKYDKIIANLTPIVDKSDKLLRILFDHRNKLQKNSENFTTYVDSNQ